jgi:F-type H+-transporting ATPase subunit b
MLIDWFTVGAQLLNFIILVWLMKRFLYQPVLDAIAAREKKIASELADAAAIQAKAQQQQDEFQQKNQVFDEERADLLQQARDAVKAERERLQTEAREEADAASAQRAKTLLIDAQQLHAEIARHAQQQVFGIARRALGDLAGVDLEQRMCEVFIERLRAVEGPALATLHTAIQAVSPAEPALLRSAFELAAPQTEAIQAALDDWFGDPVALNFEVAPELVGGLELRAKGQKLAWSISDYLGELSTDLEKSLRVQEPA